MICWQGNGYRDIEVTVNPDGSAKLVAGYPFQGTFVEKEGPVFLTYEDRKACAELFGRGMPKEWADYTKLSDDRILEVNGAACGNMGDWRIKKGRVWLITGSGNFSELTEALNV